MSYAVIFSEIFHFAQYDNEDSLNFIVRVLRSFMMRTIDEVLKDRGFDESVHVQGLTSVSDLFATKQRCGIYVLHFANDQYYVGQTTDIIRRYGQHCKNYADIEKISFKSYGKGQLNHEESYLIWHLEDKKFYLRNVDMTSILRDEPSSFDELMSPIEQEEWLRNPNDVDLGTRPKNPKRQDMFEQRYKLFRQKPCADELTNVLRAYVRNGIPGGFRGEASYWALSCLPPPPFDALVRLNINWQEVFFAYVYGKKEELEFYLCLSRSVLRQNFGDSLAAFSRKYPNMRKEIPRYSNYRAGGADQVSIYISGVQAALDLLSDPAVVPAIRLYNLRLMKKGRCVWRRSHNFWLADDLYRE